MNQNPLSIFRQHYPAPRGGRREVWIAVLFGVFVGCFLVFFRPFNLNNQPDINTPIAVAAYGLISAMVLLFFLVALPLLLSTLFQDRHWTVTHQILFYGLILFSIATANGFYINQLHDYPFRWSNYGWIITRTFALGGIPIIFIVLFDYNRKLKQHLHIAQQLSTQSATTSPDTSIIKLKSDQSTTAISLDLSTLLFIKADGNYVRIYQDKTTDLYRISLSEIEQQITTAPLLRCHRSYIVNLNQVTQVSGNAQGLKLQLKDEDCIIPVSRKYVDIVRTRLS
ncbi:MAG: LytTR family DNA-binding domain-containing protein [Bacteroidota bacterium]